MSTQTQNLINLLEESLTNLQEDVRAAEITESITDMISTVRELRELILDEDEKTLAEENELWGGNIDDGELSNDC